MNKLADKILEEVRNQGPISFARFMDQALYCPVYGYYEKEEDTVGRRGHYFTSVSVGPVFGELLAIQFSEWFRAMDGPLQLVEAGAHQGVLASDILQWLRANRTELFERLDYWLIEPSDRRREWQRRTLKDFESKVYWVANPVELVEGVGSCPQRISRHRVNGILFCNELLDSMPVHRFGWDAARGEWFEWGVTFEAGRFAWTRSSLAAAGTPEQGILPKLPPELLKILPDGFTVERCPAATQWWKQAAGALGTGKLVALDYGLTAQERLDPARPNGSLRAYKRHRLAPEPLSDPGEQDLTANVDFTAIQNAGEEAGLRTDLFATQERFLTRIAATVFSDRGAAAWPAERLRQFQTLTHPNHLGHSFRVLVQSR